MNLNKTLRKEKSHLVDIAFYVDENATKSIVFDMNNLFQDNIRPGMFLFLFAFS